VEVGIKDNTNPDDGSEVKRTPAITSSWQTYSFPLSTFSRSDTKRVYVPIELVFNGSTARTVYLRDVRYVQ